MCGIFGLIATPAAKVRSTDIVAYADALFTLSETRGKEAAGLALRYCDDTVVYKAPTAASKMIRKAEYRDVFARQLPDGRILDNTVALIGHSRLVTNGIQTNHANNQPITKSGFTGVHNGIIVNDAELWNRHSDLVRNREVDTEVFLALLAKFRGANGTIGAPLARVFDEVEGTASVALFAENDPILTLATNNGSLYAYHAQGRGLFFFCSSSFILRKFREKFALTGNKNGDHVFAVLPGESYQVDTESLEIRKIVLEALLPIPDESSPPKPHLGSDVQSETEIDGSAKAKVANVVEGHIPHNPEEADLRRCVKCILPETMPFIEFDEAGVCSFCKTYEPCKPLGLEMLREAVAPFRRSDGQPDCVVGLSGGRDSCYGLHFVKKELGLNPVAFTYDWGVITDLARRNQARLCGKLGVEHILVSADIELKRQYVRQNVNAWLKKPVLGMIPLFMAGDKQYFYYANKVRQELGLEMSFLFENKMERIGHKSGFCGIKENNRRIYNINIFEKVKIASFFTKQYLSNPRYLNSSVFDSIGAFLSSYVLQHGHHFQLFEHIAWNEELVTKTLRDEYDWELSPDTSSTWRIGDGTAAFYDYIYYTVAGFTENDGLRSNQIREGIIDRKTALNLVHKENQPRWESLQWYADTIGFDLDEAIQIINAMPKLYKLQSAGH